MQRPRKSLRTLLMLWFVLFSVVPLAFITGYSIVKYEQAINKELSERLEGNYREIEVLLKELETTLVERVTRHAGEKSLAYYISNKNFNEARDLGRQWMATRNAPHRLSIFSREGRLEVSLYVDSTGEIKQHKNFESSDVFLKADFLEKFGSKGVASILDYRIVKKVPQSMDLIVFARIKTDSGVTVGFIEEVIELDRRFLEGLKKRLNLEVLLMSKEGEFILASHQDLEMLTAQFFRDRLAKAKAGIFDLTVQEEPFGFRVQPVNWGKDQIFLGIGASKKAVHSVMANVNFAFFSVVGFIIVLLIFLSLIISRILLGPLYQLVNSIKSIDFDKKVVVDLPVSNDTELGLLSETFHEMLERIDHAQRELRKKIKELEEANVEIRDTQAKLVHTAKMASLGQMVAGVAHELNNPIGFIYSNMTHLRDYSQKLMHLVRVADATPAKLKEEKEKSEFEYIVNDMPKLIQSCEEGARRTRDIVLGLRNFSRLDEAKLKEADVEEGIEETLKLLHGELKNRIEVKKDFAKLPKILCYPSQLNQVFMNILTNAAHAIEDNGTIDIKTFKDGDNAVITIKDSGKGMSQETLSKIFDPFFTTKGVGKGTGLGLSITFGIVEKHGGEIQVKSEPKKGTTFTIKLPLSGPPR